MWTARSKPYAFLGRRSAVALILMGAVGVASADLASDSAKLAQIDSLIKAFEPRFSVTQVDAETVQLWLREQRAILVDVREPKEMAVSMVPGAITQSQFESNPALYQGKRLIAYCTIGFRSSKFAEQWTRRGVAINNLRGGMLLWAHAQGPIVDARMQATRRVHVYGASWDLLPRTYQSVY
jgi:sodium/bile acid cotransporter 7